MRRFCVLFVLLVALLSPAAGAAEDMAPSGDGYVLSGGSIYFRAVSGDDYALCRMREDLTGFEKLSDSRGYYLSVAGDALYFMADGRIRRVGTDGGGEKALARVDEWACCLVSTGDHVYVRSGDSILRYRANPWKKLGSIPARTTDAAFEIVDGWIYLSGADDTARFYRVRTDGSERGKWYDAAGRGSLCMWTVSGGKMYYGIRDSSKGIAQLRRVNLDGTGDELVLEGLWTRWIRDGWAYGTKFLSEPEIVEAEDSFDGVETRSYDTFGAYRVNIETGESQYLGDYDVFGMRPVGGLILLQDDDAWSDAPPAVIRADGTAVGLVPRLPG